MTPRAHAAPTRQQLIDFVKTTWDLTDLTDDVISQTLDTSYSGIPYKDYVSYFTVAPDILNPLLSGDYKTAGTKAAGFAADQSISFLLEEAGLSGVFAPARLAAWPIEQGLNSFQNAVKEASFKNQILLYFAARSAGNSYSEIVALAELELLSADPDILKNNRDLVMKIRYGDGQLWLAYSTSYLVGSVPGYTPAQFYDYAEQQWQSFVATKSYAAHQAIIKNAFRAAAAPQKPIITQPPQDTVIATGQNAIFTVVATGGPFTYVWRFNGTVLPTATTSSLTANSAGDYQVEVSNAAGTTPSRIATLTVNAGEPVAITAPAGSANVSGSITVRASVSGATKVEFYLDGVRQFTDSSTPFAWAWNTSIAANSSHALTAKAYNGATLLGTSATVNVTVNNAASPACSDPNEPNDSSSTATPLSIGVAANGYVCTATDVDWFKVEVATPGVVTFDLTVPAANDYDIELFGPDYTYIKGSYRDSGLAENITHDALITGTYYVRVYGYPIGSGSHNTTEPYALTVRTASGPVTIVTPPQNRAVPTGANASFGVVASGASPLRYQWQRDNTDIPGATGPTYTTPFLTLGDSGAQFRVRVTNEFGFVFSSSATLTVSVANVITWTGTTGDGNWFNRTNWNPMVIPTASDVVQLNSANLTIPANASFGVMNLNGGNLYGPFTNAGTMNWSGGTINGIMVNAASGVLNLTGSTEKVFSGGALTNQGTVNWSGSGQIRVGSWTLNNQAGALFQIQSDATLVYGFNGQPVLNNAGTLRKTGGAGTTSFSGIIFNNTGTVDIQSGTMNFNNGFTSSGVFTVAAGAKLQFAGGNYAFNSGATLNAATGGTLDYQSGSFNFSPGATVSGTTVNRVAGSMTLNGTVNLPNFELVEGGNLYGPFTNAGTMNWSGGTINGIMVNAASGVLNLTGSTEKVFSGGALTNQGTVNWSGSGQIRVGSWTLNNQAGALFQIQSDATLVYGFNGQPVLNNAGTLRKTGGAGTTSFSGIIFNNTGTVDIQRGMLLFNNGFTQTAAGTLQMEIGGLTPGTGFGRLVINGQATLAGALNVTLVNGFRPTSGDAFAVMSYASRNGNFTSTSGLALGNGLNLTPNFTSTTLTLTAIGSIVTPPILAYSRSAEGIFRVNLSGQPNINYRLDGSTNLVDWITLLTTNSASGLINFSDPESATLPNRFYRSVTP